MPNDATIIRIYRKSRVDPCGAGYTLPLSVIREQRKGISETDSSPAGNKVDLQRQRLAYTSIREVGKANASTQRLRSERRIYTS